MDGRRRGGGGVGRGLCTDPHRRDRRTDGRTDGPRTDGHGTSGTNFISKSETLSRHVVVNSNINLSMKVFIDNATLALRLDLC